MDNPDQIPLVPPQLTEQFHKARRNLVLFSAILFGWEFIGIKITEKPIDNLDVKITTPEAMPFVLLIIVIYFFYRILVEWFQSNLERRKIKASNYDLVVSIGIASISILTYLIQQLGDIQIAEKLFDKSIMLDYFMLGSIFSGGCLYAPLFFLFITYYKYGSLQVLDETLTNVKTKMSLSLYILIGILSTIFLLYFGDLKSILFGHGIVLLGTFCMAIVLIATRYFKIYYPIRKEKSKKNK